MKLADDKATRAAGAAIAAVLKPGDMVTLQGPLGAGKTTLVRGLIEALGHRGEVPSPSFAIVQPYDDTSLPVWHCDLYRLDDPAEIEELGLDSGLDEGALIVEWPEHAGPAAFPSALALSIAVDQDGARCLTVRVPAAWEGRCPFP